MQTPDNEAGRETEKVMLALTGGYGSGVPTDIYNRCYSAVYDLLAWRAAQEPK